MPPRWRHSPDHLVRALIIGLSFAGGAVDAGTYLGLGRVFPANMTGNTVLLAIAVARGTGTEAARSGLALGTYCVGVAVGTLILRDRDRDRWPAGAAATLALEAVTLAALLVGWEAFGLAPRYGLIAAAAAAMGAQSAAVRVSHVGGVTTTYVTGTLTTFVARMVTVLKRAPDDAPPSPARPGESWLVYGLGALAGAFAQTAWDAGVMAIPLVLVSASTLVALFRRRTQE